MKKGNQVTPGIGFFEKYLTIWVLMCMAAGILIGKYLPGVPDFLGKFEYAQISIPIAVLIWVMIYPMMMKVDFQSVRNVRKNPQGLIISSGTSWLTVARLLPPPQNPSHPKPSKSIRDVTLKPEH